MLEVVQNGKGSKAQWLIEKVFGEFNSGAWLIDGGCSVDCPVRGWWSGRRGCGRWLTDMAGCIAFEPGVVLRKSSGITNSSTIPQRPLLDSL